MAIAFFFVMDIRNYLFGGTTRQIVYKSLDASAMRSKVIAENLANVATPGYNRKEVNFEEQLNKVFAKKLPGVSDQERHLEIKVGADIAKIQPKVYEPIDTSLPGEINNVDIDMEMTKLAENQMVYGFGIKFAGFNKLNSAISGQHQS